MPFLQQRHDLIIHGFAFGMAQDGLHMSGCQHAAQNTVALNQRGSGAKTCRGHSRSNAGGAAACHDHIVVVRIRGMKQSHGWFPPFAL